jgi:CHASE1-domain containing sensor protein
VRRSIPYLVFIAVLVLGAIITFSAWRNEQAIQVARFELVADEAADQLQDRISQHMALLIATVGHFRSAGVVANRERFSVFTETLDLENRFRGIQGLGYALIVDPDETGIVSEKLLENYGIVRGIWPDTGAEVRTAIILLEPLDERNKSALGFDMFSEPVRREAILRALQTGEVSATAPVTLVQEITEEKQAGFLIYHPLRLGAGNKVDGFVYAPFRAGDLHQAILREQYLPVEIETRDGGPENPDAPLLYRSPGYADAGVMPLTVHRDIKVAGRNWTLSVRKAANYSDEMVTPFVLITGVISLLLAGAMAAAANWQLKAVDRAGELVALKESSLQEKDLILQEMKHRLKNSIARILAIARQTAMSSETIEAFSESFSARMQSMANAQDMLTRSHWRGIDLRELLMTELEQIYGANPAGISIEGAAVALDGRQAQAFGLTFHELATNALKYGAGRTEGKLEISWKVAGGKRPELKFNWVETLPVEKGKQSEQQPGRGFGSKLIDASIRGELGGTISRDFRPNGLKIEIVVPLLK